MRFSHPEFFQYHRFAAGNRPHLQRRRRQSWRAAGGGDQRSALATRIQSRSQCAWSLDQSARSEFYGDWSDAAANEIPAGERRLVFDDATEQQSRLDGSLPSPDDFCLGQAQTGRNCRTGAHRNENDCGAFRANISGHERQGLRGGHPAPGKSRRQIQNQSRSTPRRSRIGLAYRLREPREFVRCARRCARERVRHSRRGWRDSRADYSQASAREFSDRNPWRSAWVFHCRLAARCVDRFGTWRRFAVPTNFVRPAGARFHVPDCVVDHIHFRIVAGLANLTCQRSARVEGRFAWKRRCAIGQTDARLARDQRDCAHAHFVSRGRSRFEEFFALAIALVRLRTACALHRAARVAVAKIQ